MTDQQLYCDVSECEDPEHPGFPRPAFRSGKCSSHMKQLQRTGRTTSIAPKLSLEERLFAEAERMVEIDTSIHADRDEAIARRNVVAIAKQLGRKEVAETIKRALAAARASGKHVGRPPKADTVQVLLVYRLSGSVTTTARLLRLSKAAVSERLASVRKGRVSEQSCPRRAG